MPLTIQCTCGQLLAAPDDAAGKMVRCPTCRATLAVPDVRAAVQAQAASPPPPIPEVANVEVLDGEDKTLYEVREPGNASETGSVAGDLGRIRLRADSITCTAYGSDHATALAADERLVYFLDLKAQTGTPTRRMHRASITCLGLSPDCRWALSADVEGGLLLWDVGQRRPLCWLEGHKSEVKTTTFAADGAHAASAGVGGAVRLWKVPSGEMLALDRGQLEQCVSCLCFSPDGGLLLAIGDQGKTRLWSVALRERVGKLAKGAEDLHSAAFTPSGAGVVAGSSRRFKVCKWDADNGQRRPSFAGFADRQPRVGAIWVTPDGRCLLALGCRPAGGRRSRGDNSGPSVGEVLAFGYVGWAAMKFTENVIDASASAVGRDFYLERWDVEYENAVGKIELAPDDPPRALSCSADGRRVLIGFEEGVVRLYGL